MRGSAGVSGSLLSGAESVNARSCLWQHNPHCSLHCTQKSLTALYAPLLEEHQDIAQIPCSLLTRQNQWRGCGVESFFKNNIHFLLFQCVIAPPCYCTFVNVSHMLFLIKNLKIFWILGFAVLTVSLFCASLAIWSQRLRVETML